MRQRLNIQEGPGVMRLPKNRGDTFVAKAGRRLKVAVETEPFKQTVVYHGREGMVEIKDAQIPSMVVTGEVCGSGKPQFRFLVQHNGDLYGWPGGNAWEDGAVCWGGNHQPNTFAEAITAFWGSPFNRDLVQLNNPTEEELQKYGNTSRLFKRYVAFSESSRLIDAFVQAMKDEFYAHKIDAIILRLDRYLGRLYGSSPRANLQTTINKVALLVDSLQSWRAITEGSNPYNVLRMHSQFAEYIRARRLHRPSPALRRQLRTQRRTQNQECYVHVGFNNRIFLRIYRRMRMARPNVATSTLFRIMFQNWEARNVQQNDIRVRLWERDKIRQLWESGEWHTQVKGQCSKLPWLRKAKPIPEMVEWLACVGITPSNVPGHAAKGWAHQEKGSLLFDIINKLRERFMRRPSWAAWEKTMLDKEAHDIVNHGCHCYTYNARREYVSTSKWVRLGYTGDRVSYKCSVCDVPRDVSVARRAPQSTVMVCGFTDNAGNHYAACDNLLLRARIDRSAGITWETVELPAKRKRSKKHEAKEKA